MVTILLKALSAIFLKLIASMATEAVLEWILFKIGKMIVDSTKTPHDNEFYEQIKKAYEDGKAKKE